MSAMSRKSLIFVLLVAAMALTDCAAYRAPVGWLPKRDGVGADPYGGWIYVELGSGDHLSIVQGEYISLDDSAAYVLSSDGMIRVSFDRVSTATLRVHDVDISEFGAWGALGTVSTLTHGWYLGVTALVWIGVWIGAANAEALSGRERVDQLVAGGGDAHDIPIRMWFTENIIYARFPEGLPKGIDLNKLRGKRSLPGLH